MTTSMNLPPPNYPTITRVVSHWRDPKTAEEPIMWIVGQPHPLIGEGMTVVRMFVDDRGAEIYSCSKDGKSGMRNQIPGEFIRIVEEYMPPDVFVSELEAAEAGPPGDDDDDDDERPHEQIHPVSNGQPTT